MSLGELIAALEALPPDMVFEQGFENAHSYRGYYDELAFEPAHRVSVASMLAEARAAVGQTFQGYKGGDYTMSLATPVWLASWGSTGRSIQSIGFTLGEGW